MVLGKYNELQMNAEKKDFNICVYLRSSAVEIYEQIRVSTDARRFVTRHLRLTLGAFICGLNPFHSIKRQLYLVFTVICG